MYIRVYYQLISKKNINNLIILLYTKQANMHQPVLSSFFIFGGRYF